MLTTADLAHMHHHHVDTSWLAWPGWEFIGTCAEVLALATLVVALLQWRRARRRYPPVSWEVGTLASGPTNTAAKAFRIPLTNVGRSTAHIRSIYLVNAKIILNTPIPQIQWLVRSGESFNFDVVSDDISAAWMLIVNGNLEDNQILRAAWYALLPGTPLANEQVAGYVRAPMKNGLRGWWQKRHPKAVGPEHNAVALIQLKPNRIWEVPSSVLGVINSLNDAQLIRPGIVNEGDPNKWAAAPPEFKGLFRRSKSTKRSRKKNR